MKGVFTHSFTVNEDPAHYIRHVNNLSYLQWFIDTAIKHSNTLGWGMQKCKDLNLAWVVKNHQIEYLREAFQGDKLIIHTWIEKIDKFRSTRSYECYRVEDNKLVAKAQTLWVLVDYKTGRPKPIPQALKEKIILVDKQVRF